MALNNLSVAKKYRCGQSAAEIARFYRCSDWKIHRILRILGISKRSLSETHHLSHRKRGRGFDSIEERKAYYNQYKKDLKRRNPLYARKQRKLNREYALKKRKDPKYRALLNKTSLQGYYRNKATFLKRSSRHYYSKRSYYLEKRRQWYLRNKRKHSIKGKIWAKQNRGKKAAAYKKYILLRKLALDSRPEHNPEPWYELAATLNRLFPKLRLEVEHIIPLQKDGAHTLLNCTLLPRYLNRKKWNNLPADLPKNILKEFRKWVPSFSKGIYKSEVPLAI